ncbi:hypothetical protein CKM354_000192400 [Cercospora kikuchii]|uniref:Chitin-binding type-4 domain-containing protein n=1 Tax=Cercospora kikuchii TaxID=84275 RepID=A0A9P3FCA9_9PEZI|nr:uncharacterized protein CKM354_000192400 [Cercospora kikuchii]GIZ38507.1 hypothetical protein CKM354_000192400 [Cercospora kikuchii]
MKYLAAVAAFLELVSAHGYFETPIARQPGPAYETACGSQAYNTMKGDINGNIQGLLQLVANQQDYDAEACGLWLCKGMKFDDNTDNVQTYTAGQEVDLNFAIRAPHSGYANVSIVDTATNSIIASDLKKWDEYALTSRPSVANESQFSITIPDNLGSQCSTAGDCVIQMYWNSPPPVDQTYESCIDFTVGGSGSGTSPAPAPISTTAPAPVPTTTPGSGSGGNTTAPITPPVANGTTGAGNSTKGGSYQYFCA